MKKLCVILISASLFFQANGMDLTEDTCGSTDSEVEFFASHEEEIQFQHEKQLVDASQEDSADDFQEEEGPLFDRKKANSRKHSVNTHFHAKSKAAWIRKNVVKSGVPQKELSKTVKKLLTLSTK